MGRREQEARQRRATGLRLQTTRFGADATADWYSTTLPQLADLGVRIKVVSLLPEPTAPGIDETVESIAKAVGYDPREIAQTICGRYVGL
jgi:hypothetical protein